jgi:hypothetical protein
MSAICRRYRTLSIFWAMALPAFVLLSLIGGGVVLAVQLQTSAALDDELHRWVVTRSVNAAAELDFLLGSSDPGAATRIRALLDEPLESPARLYTFVKDPSGAVIYVTDPLTGELFAAVEAAQGDPSGSSALGEAIEQGSPSVVVFSTTKHGEVRDTAVRLDGGGMFHTGHQTGQVQQIANRVAAPLLLVVGLAVIGAVKLIGLLSRLVTAPLRSLVILVRRIEGGDYGAPERAPAFREISEL